MKILCVHGVGHQSANTAWQGLWRQSIQTAIKTTGGPDLRHADIR